MIKSIIVDDEELSRRTLSHLLTQFCPEVKIIGEFGNIKSAKEAILESKPDLVFLDVAMPGGNGFDLLSEFNTIPFDVVFVTAHDEFVLKALKFNAVDYLLKPIDETELVTAVKKVSQFQDSRLEKLNIKTLIEQYFDSSFNKNDSVCIPTTRGFQILKLDEIICCEANNSYTIFYLNSSDQIVSTKPLFEYDTMLADSGFLRIHKSWLINKTHIKEYRRGDGGSVILSNNKEVDVSRRKKDYFISELRKIFKF